MIPVARRFALLLTGILAAPLAAQSAHYSGPIIDVHQHSYRAGALDSVPPLGVLRPDLPPRYAAKRGSADAAHQLAETLDEMKLHNITLAIQNYSAGENGLDEELANAAMIHKASGGRILTGVSLRPLVARDDPQRMVAAFCDGQIVALGELAFQYLGKTANDAEFEPYFAAAEQAGIPVAIHTGSGPPRTANRGEPGFRLRYGNPLLIEDLLVRHPKLRVSLMHAGWPYLQETKGLLGQYPELYVDISVIDWVMPKAEFHTYLKALVDAGFADRIMFGSDQQSWPASIGLAVETVDQAPFLTAAQKKAIFHDNAVRFYRLNEKNGGAACTKR